MDNGTKSRTLARVLTTSGVVVAVWSFVYEKVYEAVEDVITASAVATVISLVVIAVDAWTTYFNNDYTETASQYTGEMRQKKLEQTEGYDGEVFFDDEEDEDDDEIEEVADDEE